MFLKISPKFKRSPINKSPINKLYTKPELLNMIQNLINNNSLDIKNIETKDEIFIYIITVSKNTNIIAKYEINYNFKSNNITIKIIENINDLKNLPLFIALYINPIKSNFKIRKSIFNKNTKNEPALPSPGFVYTNDKKSPYIKNRNSSISSIQINHGTIKTYNLEFYTKLIKKDNNNLKLLDLASGVGNDFNKWAMFKYKSVVGIDIDSKQIETAYKRYNEWNNRNKIDIKYYQSNLGIYDSKIMEILNNETYNGKFNIITCNFAIHYLFESKDYLNNIFKIISSYLMTGGYFIGTAIDKNILLKAYKDNITKPNPLLLIKPDKNFFDNSKIYNRAYYFKMGLESDIGTYFDEPSYEYLVDFAELKKVASEYKLKMIELSNFKKLYSLLKYKLNKKIVAYNENEEQISFLYTTFAFILEK